MDADFLLTISHLIDEGIPFTVEYIDNDNWAIDYDKIKP